MNRKTLTFLFFGAAALAVVAASTLVTSSTDAFGGCTACGGPTLTVTGHGSGNNCSEALQDAESDAIQQSFADAPDCLPCQTSSGPQACFTPSCSGACPPNSYHASFTLNYKCRTCEFGPIGPPPGP
jgi:hypothetical protein